MAYKFTTATHLEAFASGMVIYPARGRPTYPVRLAHELFLRALAYFPPNQKVTLHDPLCGQGYLLTVIGLAFGEKLEMITGSDIDIEAIEQAKENVALLSEEGLQGRIQQLEHLFDVYQKNRPQEGN